MKKLFLLFVLSGLLLAGCQEAVTGPSDPESASQPNQAGTLSVLKLPQSLTPMPMHKKISCMVTPASGGIIHYDNTYNSANGKVKIDLQLRFQPGAVAETLYVTVDINLNQLSGELSMDYGPSPQQFAKPVLLTIEAEGLESSTVPSDPNIIKLVYIQTDGSVIPTSTKKISTDPKKGKIKILEGKLPHFSRYAFIT